MCLKFLLENNPENQALISSLEAREIVPPPETPDGMSLRETMDKLGLEPRLGSDGKARMVRRENLSRPVPKFRSGRVEEFKEEFESLGLPTNGHDEQDKGQGNGKVVDLTDEDDDEIEFM